MPPRQCENCPPLWRCTLENTRCTVERPFGDGTFGVAILDHPANPNHPPGWRVDEQGLINPNVSFLGDWSIPATHERRYRYRLVVYRGSATREQMAARFAAFAGEAK